VSSRNSNEAGIVDLILEPDRTTESDARLYLHFARLFESDSISERLNSYPPQMV
jgi:hypothetical protein